jgi:dTDP-4-amino-4,6-dideoxygalactose transaminase
VILSPLAPRYYLSVVSSLGLEPVYADVWDDCPVIKPDAAREAAKSAAAGGITIKAILADWNLGYAPDIGALETLGIPVIEDMSRRGLLVTSVPKPVKSDADAGEGADQSAKAAAEDAARIANLQALPAGTFTILGLEQDDMLTAGGGALLYAKLRRNASVLRALTVDPESVLPDMNAAMALVQLREVPKNAEKQDKIAENYLRSSLRGRHKRLAQEPFEAGTSAAVTSAEQSETGSGEAPFTPEYNNAAFALVLETGMKDVAAYAHKKEIATAQAFARSVAATWDAAESDSPEDAAKKEALRKAAPAAWPLYLRTMLFPLYPRLSGSEVERVSKLVLTLP